METRNVTIILEKAREWFYSEDASLKEIALQAFNKDELICDFKNITTFKKACEALDLNYGDMACMARVIAKTSKASAAMFKLNIIKKALNLGKNLHLTKDLKGSRIYYPYNPFVTDNSSFFKSEIASSRMEVIGRIKNEGTLYNVLGDNAMSVNAGLGCFNSNIGVGFAAVNLGFLGCASKEIAQHFGKYFGMLITQAKYGDMVDFEIINSKYCVCY